jgi:dTMP kinase
MALLFAADRRDHLQREIEPALAAGSDVVSDRYLLSSLAYQAEEADRQWVSQLARDVRRPDLTILLDLPIELAALRRQRAGRPIERYDADSYLAKVARNYRDLAGKDDTVVLLDGSPDVDQVATVIVEVVEQRLLREPP